MAIISKVFWRAVHLGCSHDEEEDRNNRDDEGVRFGFARCFNELREAVVVSFEETDMAILAEVQRPGMFFENGAHNLNGPKRLVGCEVVH